MRANADTMAAVAESAAAQMPLDTTLDDFCFQIYIEVTLVQSETDEELGNAIKLYTGTMYSYELD